MFFNTFSSAARRAEAVVNPSCQYISKNIPKVTLSVSIITLALKHFYEKETSALTASEGLSISLIPLAAIVHLYRLRSKVLSHIPRDIGNGTLNLPPEMEISAAAWQDFTAKENKSISTFMLITSAEIILTTLLILLTWISKQRFKQALTVEIAQFFGEVAFMLVEARLYDYGINTLRRLKNESRILHEAILNNPQINNDASSDDESSNGSHHSNSEQEASASSHSNAAGNALTDSLDSIFNSVRPFSYEKSDSDNSHKAQGSPDSHSAPDDASREVNLKSTDAEPGSPDNPANLFARLSPIKR